MKDKIDIKNLFIFVLAISFLLSLLIRPNKNVEQYQAEIDKLHNENEKFIKLNDSLLMLNEILDKKNDTLILMIKDVEIEVNNKNEEIKKLKNGKSKVSGNVVKLNANGVSKSFTEYLERRK